MSSCDSVHLLPLAGCGVLTLPAATVSQSSAFQHFSAADEMLASIVATLAQIVVQSAPRGLSQGPSLVSNAGCIPTWRQRNAPRRKAYSSKAQSSTSHARLTEPTGQPAFRLASLVLPSLRLAQGIQAGEKWVALGDHPAQSPMLPVAFGDQNLSRRPGGRGARPPGRR